MNSKKYRVKSDCIYLDFQCLNDIAAPLSDNQTKWISTKQNAFNRIRRRIGIHIAFKQLLLNRQMLHIIRNAPFQLIILFN